jgi:hypothetical protein
MSGRLSPEKSMLCYFYIVIDVNCIITASKYMHFNAIDHFKVRKPANFEGDVLRLLKSLSDDDLEILWWLLCLIASYTKIRRARSVRRAACCGSYLAPHPWAMMDRTEV